MLKVTPHINEGDSVRHGHPPGSLEPAAAGAGRGRSGHQQARGDDQRARRRQLAARARRAASTIRLKDNEQKVPLLGDIPLLGNLFRYRTNDRTKSDLMVFLHPRILRDAATEASVSSEKYNFMRTEQLQHREEGWPITPASQRPLLPASARFPRKPDARRPARSAASRRCRISNERGCAPVAARSSVTRVATASR